MTAWTVNDIFKMAGFEDELGATNSSRAWHPVFEGGQFGTAEDRRMVPVDAMGWPTSMTLSDGRTADELWSRISDAARDVLPEQTFRTWLSSAEAVTLSDDGTLVVGAPTKFAVEWIEDKYGSLLAELARRPGAAHGAEARHRELVEEERRLARHLEENRVLREGLVSGLLGAAVVAVWFLVLDGLLRQPLFTPGALGSLLFHGVASPEQVRVTAATVWGYTVFHIAAFLLFGMVVAAPPCLGRLLSSLSRAGSTATLVYGNRSTASNASKPSRKVASSDEHQPVNAAGTNASSRRASASG